MATSFLDDVATATGPGALSDIPGFVLENIQKYLQSFGPANEKRAALFKQLQQGAAEPGLLHDLTSEAAGLSNPMAGILGPIGRVTTEALGSAGGAKAVNQAQKKIVKALFRADPETLKEVVENPRMMHVGVPGAGGGLPKQNQQQLVDATMEGAYAHFQPGGLGGTVRVDPRTMRGLDVKPRTGSKILKEQGVEGLPDMVTHEATHFLNDPGYTAMQGGFDPNGQLTEFARSAIPFIRHTKFGPSIVAKHLSRGRPDTAVNELLSYLSQPTGRSEAGTWLHNMLTNRERGPMPKLDEATQSLLQDVIMNSLSIPGIRR